MITGVSASGHPACTALRGTCQGLELQRLDAYLQLDELDGIPHGHRQGSTLHKKLDGRVELVGEIPRQHFALGCHIFLRKQVVFSSHTSIKSHFGDLRSIASHHHCPCMTPLPIPHEGCAY